MVYEFRFYGFEVYGFGVWDLESRAWGLNLWPRIKVIGFEAQ